ncbi:MAG: uroporphyrinogen-III synthase [Nitrososphaerota archaeon]|nr:uroporphyrinogen-III synthase [Nitrososphaerota archaeon]
MKVVLASIWRNWSRLRSLARKNGFEPVFVSALKIMPIDISAGLTSYLRNGPYSWAIFTSSTAASIFFKADVLVRSIYGVRIAAVGSGTSAFLKRKGIKVDFLPSEYTTEKLAEELPANPGSKVLMLRSEDGSGLAESVLNDRGIQPYRLNLYRTSFSNRYINGKRLDGAKIIIFGSSKEVIGFENRLVISHIDGFKKHVIAASVGPLTNATAMKLGYRVMDIPKAYTYSSLFEMLGELKNEGRI